MTLDARKPSVGRGEDKGRGNRKKKCRKGFTSAIIKWQSKMPFPNAVSGLATCDRMCVTTGAPNVMLGTKCPSMISTCSQSAPWVSIVSEHALPRLPKSAERIEGAIMAFGAIFSFFWGFVLLFLLLGSGTAVPLFWVGFMVDHVLWCVYPFGEASEMAA